ncbi:sulfite exporter TauE/SafE family protein [Occultella glacieicola]|uniref:Probable membrane transporter protein n=1 Tax=Occultella glacieicola TaxID=2518684 RepID=A0ABY2DX64_9MICO|nr:sulfite exporter TauE/SafE family protein [Occultella glacieicola]TDE88566.1 sulfite exporter TauE/SafE family protein [Occultella glacieicola]
MVVPALLAVVVGALLQRLTGMGFALVSAPFLVLLLGPFDGVLVANAGGAFSSLILLRRLRSWIDWHRFRYLMPAALVGIVPGAWVALNVPSHVLDLSIGLIVVLGMTASLIAARADAASGTLPMLLLGGASGFMNVTAGVGGPALSVYGVVSRWSQLSFAATLQPLFLVMGLVSLGVKWAGEPAAFATLGWPIWLGVAAAVLVGLALGTGLARWVGPGTARVVVIVMAYAGGVATLLRGLFAGT